MAESVQRIIVGRALTGQHPQHSQEVIQWLEETVAGWNAAPTPFVWDGRRRERRVRARVVRAELAAREHRDGFGQRRADRVRRRVPGRERRDAAGHARVDQELGEPALLRVVLVGQERKVRDGR